MQGEINKNANSIFNKLKITIIPGSQLKSRDITLPTKVCLVKAMVFPVVMHGCESWPIKLVNEFDPNRKSNMQTLERDGELYHQNFKRFQ